MLNSNYNALLFLWIKLPMFLHPQLKILTHPRTFSDPSMFFSFLKKDNSNVTIVVLKNWKVQHKTNEHFEFLFHKPKFLNYFKWAVWLFLFLFYMNNLDYCSFLILRSIKNSSRKRLLSKRKKIDGLFSWGSQFKDVLFSDCSATFADKQESHCTWKKTKPILIDFANHTGFKLVVILFISSVTSLSSCHFTDKPSILLYYLILCFYIMCILYFCCFQLQQTIFSL